MKRSHKRPAHLDPPTYLARWEPAPKPSSPATSPAPAGEEKRLDPTRYGDWVKKGIAVDF